MGSELIDKLNFEDTTDLSSINPKEISAIFNLLNGKPDSIVRIFPRDIKICLNDLDVLKERIDEKLEHFDVIASVNNISVKFDNSTFKEFSSWLMFKNHNWRGSNSIENITIKWDFMIKLNGYNLPQRHTIVVRISSGLKPEQLLHMMLSGQIEDMDSIDKNLVPVICKVDFINNLLGDEIINIVEEWNNGLKTSYDTNKVITFMRKNRVKCANAIKNIIPIFILITLASIFNQFIGLFNVKSLASLNIGHIQNIVWFMVCSYICFTISKSIGMWLARNLHEALYNYGGMHTFDITYGDRNKQEKIDSENNKNKKNMLFSIGATIIINIACGVIASYVFMNLQ